MARLQPPPASGMHGRIVFICTVMHNAVTLYTVITTNHRYEVFIEKFVKLDIRDFVYPLNAMLAKCWISVILVFQRILVQRQMNLTKIIFIQMFEFVKIQKSL